MSRNTNRIKREKYYNNNPYCFWCGIRTILFSEKRNATNLATIDHIFPQFHPARRYCGKTVLSCNECNSDRNYIALRLLPILLDEEREDYEVRKMSRIKINRDGIIEQNCFST